MYSYKTAISRKTASKPTRDFFQKGLLSGNILDYGCGKGADVTFLKKQGLSVTGYDPHYCPEFNKSKKYDVVLCNYVINVIPHKTERRELIRNLLKACKVMGIVIITARPIREIEYNANRSNWTPVKDGFKTKRGTFQKGFAVSTIMQYLPSNGKLKYRLIYNSEKSYSYIVIRKLSN